MKPERIIAVILLLVLIGEILYLINTYEINVTIAKRAKPVVKPPSALDATCGIENCHGLEITCGSNVPAACTLEYAFGDRCREFATCEKQNKGCQLVTDPRFTTCKTCVERCAGEFPNDPVQAFACESACVPSSQ